MTDAIGAIYTEVHAPAWAARNLDALADVLRDLSWLPDGPVTLRLPAPEGPAADDSRRLTAVLREVASETAGGRHPVVLVA